jgi:DNA-binding CsgD family transcriptional regulator
MSKELKHYGIKRRSGRYPWGSGEDPEQRGKSFLGQVDELAKKGLSEVKIAEGLGMNTQQLRAKKSLAKAEQRKSDYAEALRLKNKGYSNVEIGKRMGKNESSIRALLDPAMKERSEVTNVISNVLKDNVDKKKYLDVGLGVENHLGVSRTKLKTALEQLKEDGYKLHSFKVEQVGTGEKTNMMVLTKGDVSFGEVMRNRDKIRLTTDYSEDGGRSFLGLEPINSVSSKRVQIRYSEEGGAQKDGIIELRRGVEDISLGNAKYSQVRIGVDGTHYMKGMAVYSDNIPKGVDIIYNTNKSVGTSQDKVFKEMKDDPDNPFGSTVRQQHHITAEGKKFKEAPEMLRMKQAGLSYEDISKKTGIPLNDVKKAIKVKALNIVNEEGDWGEWSKSISSQVLSKQTTDLAKKQLGLSYDAKKDEFDELASLTNPVVKRKLLDSFADDADSAAVHLKAASLPRQATHVLIPFPTIKESEIYAPNYNNGEKVILIRYPHGGRFEIPELTVNNKHKEANNIIKNAKDAVGINHKVAEKLSGADFDGDTVLVIPNNKGSIKTAASLQQLKDFDPKTAYPAYEGMPRMTARAKGMQMGLVSNLITDMTIKGATYDEIAKAVKHSMVVIDAEKHHLNYKQSYIDNGIAALNEKYQGKARGGASTLISRASSVVYPNARKESIDPETGKKIYTYTGESYVTRSGKEKFKTTTSTKLAETSDAFSLSSGTPMETVYANHANKLKALANEARKTSLSTKPMYTSPSAKKLYAKEVATLDAQLNTALKNKPLERQAQLLANTIVASKKAANPNMDAADLKKIKGQALAEARARMGAKKQDIVISEKEWEAIQSGAISSNKLMQILNNTDLDRVKQLATPRTTTLLTPIKEARIKNMIANGYTQSEIANQLGVSTKTISNLMQ